MSENLPRLRLDLDFTTSPLDDRPGLLIRDPFQYSDAALIVPAALVECLQLFDGHHSNLDLRDFLVRITGDIQVGELEQHFVGALSEAGFLHDGAYERRRDEQHAAFARADRRLAAHAGGGYPADAAELRATLHGYLDGRQPVRSTALRGIAAPHVSPGGGRESYADAYALLGPEHQGRTFVILGTSHYGEPNRFGLTRKPFVTPYGDATVETGLVDALEREGGPAVNMEDYCHAVEHSIEFQVVFLQHVFGPAIRILPILCGPFVPDGGAGRPEDDDNVRRFLDALGALASREGNRLHWVLGVDMAHMGRRYGDPFAAEAGNGHMNDVAELDRQRIGHITAGDADGFWGAVQGSRDALKWCGASPFYTFLKAVPGTRADLLRYEQWNIDEESVVSFGALAFY
jgi:MEMO1 family protein